MVKTKQGEKERNGPKVENGTITGVENIKE